MNYVVMDAPPQLEKARRAIRVQRGDVRAAIIRDLGRRRLEGEGFGVVHSRLWW